LADLFVPIDQCDSSRLPQTPMVERHASVVWSKQLTPTTDKLVDMHLIAKGR